MAKDNKVPTYNSWDIDDRLVREGSVLNQYQQRDALSFDQDFEGVPAENVITGGLRAKKTSYSDTQSGVWIGVDKDGLGKINVGNNSDYLLWDGTKLTVSGTITSSTFQTAETGERIVISSTTSNAIQFLDDNDEYGRLEVIRDGTDGVVRLVDPYNGGFGVYLRATTGSGSNTTASLIAQGATITAGGKGAVYQAQLLLSGGDYFGAFYDSPDGNRVVTSMDVLPDSDGVRDLGTTSVRWGTIYCDNLVATNGTGGWVGSATSDLDMNNNDIIDCSRIEGNGNEIDFASSSTRIFSNEDFDPNIDNSHDLGAPADIWNDIYVSDVNYDTFTLMSDRNEKRNIKPTKYGLKEVLQLSAVQFNYKRKKQALRSAQMKELKKKNPEKYKTTVKKQAENFKKRADRHHIGFIAQDVEPIIPELVRQNKEGVYTLQATEIIPVLVNAVQELSAEVERLNKKTHG